jgi:hypothetical protein
MKPIHLCLTVFLGIGLLFLFSIPVSADLNDNGKVVGDLGILLSNFGKSN